MARFYQPKKKSAVNTKHQIFNIEKLDHHGAGIAYHNKKPVFIDGALPGESVIGQFTEQKSKFARAKLIKIQKESEQRVTPFCQHYQTCGGCNLQHLARQSQVEHKNQTLQQLMKKFSGSELTAEKEVTAGNLGYRRRARISLFVDKKSRELQFGFREKMSKRITNIDNCAVLHPDLEALLVPVKQLLAGFAGQENLGHVELVKASNTRVLLLRHTAALKNKDKQSLLAFADEHDLTLYLMPSADELERVRGEQPIYDEVGVELPFEPTNFIQVNEEVNQKMVAQALEWLNAKPDEHILDLFCGLGNFSLPLAKQASSVIGVEGVQEMVDVATRNAQLNRIENVSFYQANLAEDMTHSPWAKKQFDKILLDPARAGAVGIVDQFSRLGAKAVVYVSCNPATLARDSQSLLNQGYKLKKVGMLDMFPHTSHLESMALFEKD
ncbi:23S rRNA (uracil-5-)-methyltransferase rumA [Vibrio nigripulchritudo MADA3029]|uniref:23S rRNA (uracil(1939)-C(5))-methyltransferase RlmD n=1 Tax=Vibrio nigripulchritudo TaxID=28173 RepID=UPI0003B1D182|nr:23S rRNA (uracil(1939)-C(5))-methyltransferase RlmD [Vibrio nigripulchritudo]CCN50608.1 23S rRNA (uracil-5-)-methyltransferase rumA [Vibrio nigripulchritudo MADA3020]CCN53856.1 23S rRNA (uracil-5-)-methyltransferase rumA [Vibrio nigripulchritudo MADA3021]CCN59894.1 23S rRNA (uracil-5-)-methyltransferase rumA [Vibrio nigripulchritudo MADA3029]